MMTNKQLSIGPSHAHRWSSCTGSPAAAAGIKRERTENQLEGDAAHWLAAEILKSYQAGGEILNPRSIDQAPNGVEITDEMIEAVDLYVMDVLKSVNSAGVLQKLCVEHRITIDRIHPQCIGTVDAWFFDEKRGVIHLWDFKFGRRFVDHNGSSQMDAYAIGIVDLLGVDDQHVRVVSTIVQPRNYHPLGAVRRDEYKAVDLRLVANDLHDKAHLVMNGSNALQTGDHCHYCPAQGKCTAALQSSFNAIDFADVTDEALDPTNDELALLIRTLRAGKKRVDDLLNALEPIAEVRVKAGEVVQGFALQAGRGAIDWNVPAKQVIAIGEMMGVDLRKDGVKTPTQSKKLIDESVINPYIKHKAGATKLVESEQSLAHHVFKPVNKR